MTSRVLRSAVGPEGRGSSVGDVLWTVQVLSQIVIFLPYAMQFSFLLEINFLLEVLVKNILAKA